VTPATPLPDDVRVWRVDVPSDPAALAALAASLTAGERAWADRLRAGAARARFVAARAALRRLIAARLGCAPAEVPLRTGEGGRPELGERPGAPLRFSVSHSGDVALVALAARAVGVDVEAARRVRHVVALASRVFRPSEAAHVERAPAAEQARRFLELWTAKEAVLKASGVGLPGLADVEVEVGPEGATAARGAGGVPWAVRTFEPAPGCVGAVAAAALPARIALLPSP